MVIGGVWWCLKVCEGAWRWLIVTGGVWWWLMVFDGAWL